MKRILLIVSALSLLCAGAALAVDDAEGGVCGHGRIRWVGVSRSGHGPLLTYADAEYLAPPAAGRFPWPSPEDPGRP